jgi:hypothetical protein
MMPVAMALLVIACSALLAVSADDDKPKYKIKEVMKIANKDGLHKKVVGGKASDDEKKQLLELYEALAKNKPPKGAEDSWKEKTEALVKAAKAVVEGTEGAAKELGTAANCGACHKEHKP